VNSPFDEAIEQLRAAGFESPRVEARMLLQHAQEDLKRFVNLVSRRLAHEPIAYITGHKEFWSLDFDVGPGALIPRPETETLVEQALCEMPNRDARHRILDLGTGSGCLLVALLREFPNAQGLGIDISPAALRWAIGIRSRAPLT
jgi:release factor glutamine methyltransferase